MAPGQSSSSFDPDTPSFDGYESGSHDGQLEDAMIPDTDDEDDQSATLFATQDTQHKRGSESNYKADSPKKMKCKSKSKTKSKNNTDADAKSEMKSSSSLASPAAATAAKEKRPLKKADQNEGIKPGDGSVAKKIKREKAVGMDPIPVTVEGTNADDHVVEKVEKKKKKKKTKKSLVSTTDHDHNSPNTNINTNGTDINYIGNEGTGAGEEKRSTDDGDSAGACATESGGEKKTTDDVVDVDIGDVAGEEKLEEKEEKKNEDIGGFVGVMEECARYLANHGVDWKWLSDQRLVKTEKMWVELKGAESTFRSLQADFDGELHRLARDAYVSYQDR